MTCSARQPLSRAQLLDGTTQHSQLVGAVNGLPHALSKHRRVSHNITWRSALEAHHDLHCINTTCGISLQHTLRHCVLIDMWHITAACIEALCPYQQAPMHIALHGCSTLRAGLMYSHDMG